MRWKVEKTVFFGSSAIILSVVAFAVIDGEGFQATMGPLQQWIALHLGWFYTLAVATLFAVALWAMMSRVGRLRLGSPEEAPAYSFSAWLAMLFSAGMGIGLVFNGVAEPISHFASPPGGAAPGTLDAARDAMRYTFLHWGIHAWAIYAVTGLLVAYAAYRKGLPLAIRSIFFPVLGHRIYGPIGDIIEIPAVIGTLFGVAASLGVGVTQVNAGLSHLTGIPQTAEIQVALVIIITLAATASVVSGLDKGILLLSQLNMVLFLAILGFVFVLGPTTTILRSFVENTGTYLQELPALTFRTGVYDGTNWAQEWTYMYWPWWIAWAPFVGIFIARISRGRTIREFIAGVLIVPSLVTFIWMCTFGETAMRMDMAGDMEIARQVAENMPISIYVFLERFPLGALANVVATVLVITFFVTSSDSGSFVVDIIASGGNPEPPVMQRVYWAFLEGAIAVALLLGGGLKALQNVSIALALPFCIVLLWGCYAFVRSTRGDTDHIPSSELTVIEMKVRTNRLRNRGVSLAKMRSRELHSPSKEEKAS
ncbi:MAG: BCCT family transporter [Myxococcota bacterium]